MYYIVSPGYYWSYKRAFGDFATAFMIQQLIKPSALIEYFDGFKREIVWNPRWEYEWC